MFLTLPDSGLKVKLWVDFSNQERRQGVYRNTKVTVYTMTEVDGAPTEVEFAVGLSRCSPQDNFCRLVGRKLACIDLFAKPPMRDLSKNDRKTIFDAVCAAYRKRAEKGKKVSS